MNLAENARALNNWLVNEWLVNYPYNNVAVFDFFTVLTTNGGNPDTNDFGWPTGNHHRLVTTTSPIMIEHLTDGDDDESPHTMEYPRSGGDLHPTEAGTQKATGEFVPVLNYYYNCWKYGHCMSNPADTMNVTAFNPTLSVAAGNTVIYYITVTTSDEFTDTVTLTLSGAPAGTSHSFAPNSEVPPFTSDLMFTTTSSTPLGTHLMTVIADGGNIQDTFNISITVNQTSSLPVAIDDNVSTVEDSLLTIEVTANDSDPDGNLELSSVNTTCSTCIDPAHGMLVNNCNGTFEYMPETMWNGEDTFVYEICDTGGLCDTAKVTITVNVLAPTVINFSTSANSDDTVELISGRIAIRSKDHQLVYDGKGN
jgi:hypothetical protein